MICEALTALNPLVEALVSDDMATSTEANWFAVFVFVAIFVFADEAFGLVGGEELDRFVVLGILVGARVGL